VVDGFYLGRVAPRGKLSHPVLVDSRVNTCGPAWAVVEGFDYGGPGAMLSDMLLVESRVKLVGSGLVRGRWVLFRPGSTRGKLSHPVLVESRVKLVGSRPGKS
jgi:hypothetical protein